MNWAGPAANVSIFIGRAASRYGRGFSCSSTRQQSSSQTTTRSSRTRYNTSKRLRLAFVLGNLDSLFLTGWRLLLTPWSQTPLRRPPLPGDDTMAPSERQLFAISVTERVCSTISLIGTFVIVATFIGSRSFRKPINRLVFYASWGNIMANIATLISQSGIHAGVGSSLCQFQAFLIQW